MDIRVRGFGFRLRLYALTNMVGQLVWFITGASKGLGLALARRALLRGDLVVATARDTSKLEEVLFSDSTIERSHAFVLAVDISWSTERLARIVAEAASHWGRIDVLVRRNLSDVQIPLMKRTGEQCIGMGWVRSQ